MILSDDAVHVLNMFFFFKVFKLENVSFMTNLRKIC